MPQQYSQDSLINPRDLTALDKRVYEPKTSELKARSIFAVKSDIPAGARTYTYNVMTRSGAAKILAPGASDVPLVDADLDQDTVKIYSVVAAFGIDVQEVREANMLGIPLDATKAELVRKAIAEKENQLAFVGDSKYNIKGLTNLTGVQILAASTNEGGKTTWADKTGDEIVSDILTAKGKVDILNGHEANVLLLTAAAKQIIQRKVYNEFTKQTVLQYLNSENTFELVETVNDLKGKGTGGTDTFVVLDRSADVVELGIPMEITRHPQEYAFPRTKIPFEERTTGLIVRYPMAIVRTDGI